MKPISRKEGRRVGDGLSPKRRGGGGRKKAKVPRKVRRRTGHENEFKQKCI